MLHQSSTILPCQIKKKNKPKIFFFFFFYTGDQKFQTNRSKQIEILEITQLFNSTINRNSTSKSKA